jgi:hypothetical protein
MEQVAPKRLGAFPSTDKPTNFAVLAGTSARRNWNPFVPYKFQLMLEAKKCSSTPQISWSGSTSSPAKKPTPAPAWHPTPEPHRASRIDGGR